MVDRKLPEHAAPNLDASPPEPSAIARTRTYFERHGASATVREIVYGLLRKRAEPRSDAMSRRFDEENQVRTDGRIFLSDMSVVAASTDQSMWYEPAPINVIPNVLHKLRASYDGYTFIDLGSGLGRVVLQASQFNFEKIVGVEFAENLYRQAVENLHRYPRHKQKCRNVELLCTDVRAFEFPETDSVIFIYDAFKAELLQSIVERLRASHLACPRKIYLVYLNPDQRNNPIPIIEGSGFLFKKEIFGFMEHVLYYRNNMHRVVVYETT